MQNVHLRATVFLGFILAGTFGVHAQTSTRFAFKIGLNTSVQSIELPARELRTLPYEFHRRIGFEGAFGFEFFASSYISILAQFEYSQRGTGEEAPPPYGNSIIKYHRVDYLSIPILMRMTLTTSKPHPSFLFGPRISLPIGYQNLADNVLRTVYDNLKRPSDEWCLGIGIEPFPATIMECRYDFNLDNAFQYEDYIVKGNTFNITLGYLF